MNGHGARLIHHDLLRRLADDGYVTAGDRRLVAMRPDKPRDSVLCIGQAEVHSSAW